MSRKLRKRLKEERHWPSLSVETVTIGTLLAPAHFEISYSNQAITNLKNSLLQISARSWNYSCLTRMSFCSSTKSFSRDQLITQTCWISIKLISQEFQWQKIIIQTWHSAPKQLQPICTPASTTRASSISRVKLPVNLSNSDRCIPQLRIRIRRLFPIQYTLIQSPPGLIPTSDYPRQEQLLIGCKIPIRTPTLKCDLLAQIVPISQLDSVWVIIRADNNSRSQTISSQPSR